jgi:mono/diheme cytochrome c family protein
MNNNLRYIILTVSLVGTILLGNSVQVEAGSKASGGDAERGKNLFVRYCTGCHGPEGGGGGYKFLSGPDPANLRSPSIKKKSDVVLLKTIHEGKPNMPPWNTRLSEKESRDVLAYVRTLAK